jgi:nitroreductase
MKLYELVQNSRSYRRFDENYQISGEILRDLVTLAQYSPSGRNAQPLKFWLSNTPQMNNQIFPHLGWAGALIDWSGPGEGERPSAYIIILGDTYISENFGMDHGIAAQSILLGATEVGLGGCMIGSVGREALQKAVEIPERFKVLLVIALGKPAEEVIIETVNENGSVIYYRDADDKHHVPKRGLDELILNDV